MFGVGIGGSYSIGDPIYACAPMRRPAWKPSATATATATVNATATATATANHNSKCLQKCHKYHTFCHSG